MDAQFSSHVSPLISHLSLCRQLGKGLDGGGQLVVSEGGDMWWWWLAASRELNEERKWLKYLCLEQMLTAVVAGSLQSVVAVVM